jgi:hypothetical protein
MNCIQIYVCFHWEKEMFKVIVAQSTLYLDFNIAVGPSFLCVGSCLTAPHTEHREHTAHTEHKQHTEHKHSSHSTQRSQSTHRTHKLHLTAISVQLSNPLRSCSYRRDEANWARSNPSYVARSVITFALIPTALLQLQIIVNF